MSNVVAEAMACGAPVIATRVGDNERLVGQTGWLVEPGCQHELVAALEQARVAQLDTRGDEARSRIVNDYSAERMIERTEAALIRLIAAT
jgi:glycosyltransferase involved in cell wall biosynthesis